MKIFVNYFISCTAIILFFQVTHAQTQTVRGVIKDAQAEYPLIGVSVILLGSDPVRGTSTDLDPARNILLTIPINPATAHCLSGAGSVKRQM